MGKIGRRRFIQDGLKAGTALAGLALASRVMGNKEIASPLPDIAIATNNNYYKAAIQAVENLGGIGRFVKKGDRVALLANSAFKKPGTYTRPDVLLAVIYLCLEAGAKEVVSLKNEKKKYWRRSPLSKEHANLIAALSKNKTDHVPVKIPKAEIVKEADVFQALLDCDSFINIPVVKDHSGTRFTCCLKNMMGASAFSTNIKFHFGPNPISKAIMKFGDFYNDMDYFNQSIADLNLVRTPNLCVVDATEFIATNGPSGPGELKRLNKVVAGRDCVATDAYCSKYLGLSPDKVGMIKKADAMQIGSMDLNGSLINEI